jgi:polar amino acid transport system substrate-binding protein
MKARAKTKVMWLVALVLLQCGLMAETITLRADSWEPYNGEPGSEMPGYMIEIANKVFGEAGHKVEYKTLNWARTVKDVESGKIDGAVGAGDDEVEGGILPEEELGVMLNTFYVRKGFDWKYTGLESLKKVKVAIIREYTYDDELDKYFAATKGSKVQVIGGDDPLTKNFTKLLKSKVDVVLEDRSVADQLAGKMKISDKVEAAGTVGDGDKLYIAFSPKKESSKVYAKLLSDGVKKMRASGELQKLLDKYGLKDWKK